MPAPTSPNLPNNIFTSRTDPSGRFGFFCPVALGLLALLALLAGSGCHLDYGKNVESKDLQQNVPDMVITGSLFRIVRDDHLVMELSARRAETYAQANQRIMTGVKFIHYNYDGSVSARGEAGRAVQNIQTDDVQFTDGLKVDILSEGAEISAERIEWTAKDKIMRSGSNQMVAIRKQNGSIVKGYGLVADLPSRTIELTGNVEGTLSND